MKKLITAVVFAFLLSVGVHAAVGDVAGVYYSTDIVTTLNGYEISSVNIGGETLISAEDMAHYGFVVMWYPEWRELYIEDAISHKPVTGCEVTLKSDSVGKVLGNYYETDIVTYLNGTAIKSYNLGCRTYIHAEEMRGYNQNVTWHPKERWLEISTMAPPPVWGMKLMAGKEQTADAEGYFRLKYSGGETVCEGDAGYFDLILGSGKDGYSATLAFYQYQGGPWSAKLMHALDDAAYKAVYDDDYWDWEIYNKPIPAEKYEAAAKIISLSVNGFDAEKIAVSIGAGNGHRDYFITMGGIPIYQLEEIEEIVFEINTEELS